eukprot:1514606-Rhodomonas_salina.1
MQLTTPRHDPDACLSQGQLSPSIINQASHLLGLGSCFLAKLSRKDRRQKRGTVFCGHNRQMSQYKACGTSSVCAAKISMYGVSGRLSIGRHSRTAKSGNAHSAAS